MITIKKKRIFLGRNKEGEKFYLNLEFRRGESGISTNHETLDEYETVSFSGYLLSKYGSMDYDRGIISVGQNYEHLLRLVYPAKGFRFADICHIHNLWRTYHLNDMQSHCAHQDKAVKWDEVAPCSVTGYKAGSAWLVEPLKNETRLEILEAVKLAEVVAV